MRKLLVAILFLAAPAFGQVTHPPTMSSASLPACNISRDGTWVSLTDASTTLDCNTTGGGNVTATCKCEQQSAGVFAWVGVATGAHTVDTDTDDQDGAEVPLDDVGAFYTTDNVEAALQQVGPTMTDARTPTAHASTHASGQSDALPDLTQYALLGGRAGGQAVYGSNSDDDFGLEFYGDTGETDFVNIGGGAVTAGGGTSTFSLTTGEAVLSSTDVLHLTGRNEIFLDHQSTGGFGGGYVRLDTRADDAPCAAGNYRLWVNTAQARRLRWCENGTIASILTDANIALTGDVTSSGLTTTVDAAIHRDSEVKDGDLVSFDDANADFTATDVDEAIEELVTVNGSGVNSATAKVDWTQLGGVPAGFADGTDDGGGGTDDQIASEVPFTPAGTIAATDVQAAIEEVASEAGGGGANPAGSGSELQFRLDGTTFGAVASSSVSGANVTLGGTLGGLTQLDVDNLRFDLNTISSTLGSTTARFDFANTGGGYIKTVAPFFDYAPSSGTSNWRFTSNVLETLSSGIIVFTSGAIGGSRDAGLRRVSAGLLASSNGGTGNGSFQALKYVSVVQAFSIADDGAGTKAAGTLTPTSSYVECSCLDANACDVTMSETGALQGQALTIVNIGTNACDFADTGGISELPAGGVSLGTNDSLGLIYASDRWIATSRSDN